MDFIEHFFGQFTAGEYLAFIMFSIIGNLIIKVIRYLKKKAELKSEGKKMSFKFDIWIDDNLLDFILAVLCSFLAYRFFPDALSFMKTITPIGEYEEKMFYGLLLGLSFQYLLHLWMNKVTVDKTVSKMLNK